MACTHLEGNIDDYLFNYKCELLDESGSVMNCALCFSFLLERFVCLDCGATFCELHFHDHKSAIGIPLPSAYQCCVGALTSSYKLYCFACHRSVSHPRADRLRLKFRPPTRSGAFNIVSSFSLDTNHFHSRNDLLQSRLRPFSNHGFSCYLSVALHVFFAVIRISPALSHNFAHHSCTPKPAAASNGCFLCELRKLYVEYTEKYSNLTIDASNVFAMIQSSFRDVGKQQDPLECFEALLSYGNGIRGLAEVFTLSVVDTYTCTACPRVANFVDRCGVLHVPLPDNGCDSSVNECLEKLFTCGADVKDRSCADCGGELLQSRRLQRPPEVLIVAINRIRISKTTLLKDKRRVTVDSALQIKGDTGDYAAYELIAAFEHHGKSPTSGHCTAVVRDPNIPGRPFLRIDDRDVSTPKDGLVDLERTGHCFFYRRLSTSSDPE